MRKDQGYSDQVVSRILLYLAQAGRLKLLFGERIAGPKGESALSTARREEDDNALF